MAKIALLDVAETANYGGAQALMRELNIIEYGSFHDALPASGSKRYIPGSIPSPYCEKRYNKNG